MLKLCVVMLKIRIWTFASSEDIFASFEYFGMKKGTQKVEMLDLNLTCHTKWSLKYIKWFFAEYGFQVILSQKNPIWSTKCTSEGPQAY